MMRITPTGSGARQRNPPSRGCLRVPRRVQTKAHWKQSRHQGTLVQWKLFKIFIAVSWQTNLEARFVLKKIITLHSYAPSPHLPHIFTHICEYCMQFHCAFTTRFNRLSAVKWSANTAETLLHRRHKSRHCALPRERNRGSDGGQSRQTRGSWNWS